MYLQESEHFNRPPYDIEWMVINEAKIFTAPHIRSGGWLSGIYLEFIAFEINFFFSKIPKNFKIITNDFQSNNYTLCRLILRKTLTFIPKNPHTLLIPPTKCKSVVIAIKHWTRPPTLCITSYSGVTQRTRITYLFFVATVGCRMQIFP